MFMLNFIDPSAAVNELSGYRKKTRTKTLHSVATARIVANVWTP